MADYLSIEDHVSTLMNQGADAAPNLYDVYFTFPAGITGADDTANTGYEDRMFTVRCKDLTLPSPKQKLYDVHYKTVNIKRPAAKLDFERSIEIPFRLDAYYDVYRYLSMWRNRTMTPSTGFATNELSSGKLGKIQGANLGKITVVALAQPVAMSATFQGNAYTSDGVTAGFLNNQNNGAGSEVPWNADLSTNFTYSWIYMDAWITELSEPAYKREGTDPIEVKAKFSFGRYYDPFANQNAAFTDFSAANNVAQHLGVRTVNKQ